MSEFRVENLEVEIGDILVVSDFELRICSGEIWGLLGPNGAGKTTLLNCLAGLRDPLNGRVLAGDTNVHTSPRREVARKLGMLEQHTVYHFDATVKQIALTGRHPHLHPLKRESAEDVEMARAALESVDLSGFEQRGVTSLSGGEARRLAIATLLVQEPDVMLLDEPTNHLDLAHQASVMDLISARANNSNCCVLAALHDINLASRYCSHVVLLMGDGLWRAGPTEEVLSKTVVQELYSCPVEEFKLAGRRFFYPGATSSSPDRDERRPS